MYMELQRERKRIAQIQEPTVKKLTMEIADTVMSYIEDLNGFTIQLRDWIGATFADVNQRLVNIEVLADDMETPPALDENEVIKITELAGKASALAAATLEASAGATQEAKNELIALMELAKEVVDIVADAEEEEDEEEPEPEVEQKTEAAGGTNGASTAS
jgi:hypothetical protein